MYQGGWVNNFPFPIIFGYKNRRFGYTRLPVMVQFCIIKKI